MKYFISNRSTTKTLKIEITNNLLREISTVSGVNEATKFNTYEEASEVLLEVITIAKYFTINRLSKNNVVAEHNLSSLNHILSFEEKIRDDLNVCEPEIILGSIKVEGVYDGEKIKTSAQWEKPKGARFMP